MKSIDFRNATFEQLRGRGLAGLRAEVLNAWQLHGPGTTEQIAQRSKIDILNVRPRTTELREMGFVCLTDQQDSNTEGTYRARTVTEHLRWFMQQQRDAQPGQKEFSLGT